MDIKSVNCILLQVTKGGGTKICKEFYGGFGEREV